MANDVYSQKTLWARLFNAFLGLWLIAIPLTFQYGNRQMLWSDLITGILVFCLACWDIPKPRMFIKWLLFALGLWLQFAPLVFWAPDPIAYLNDTFVGALLIGFSIVLPTCDEMMQPPVEEIPPGWSYNPSSWLQRAPVAFFAILGWFISRYLAAYQLGYIHTVWDPFFGDGTLKVITSSISKSFPVSDAGLGAIAYSLEALLAIKGGTARWRTTPWMVLFFGILVIPLGFVSLLLIMLQPIVVGFWCGLCLITAFCMLVMMALSLDEVIAVIDFLGLCRSRKTPLWHVFWRGAPSLESATDTRTPAFNSSLNQAFPAMTWGVSIPWNLFLTLLVGIWQLFVSNFLGAAGIADAINHICGTLAILFSVIAWAEVIRSCRYLNIIVGFILFFNLYFLSGHTAREIVNDGIVAALLIFLSLRRGPILERYGAWTSKIR